MGNDLDGSPYKIDTAGVIFEKPILVKQMVWQEPAVAGEDLIVLDSNGRVLWDENAYAGGTGISIEQDFNIVVNGITLNTIDSGTLYIYFTVDTSNLSEPVII